LNKDLNDFENRFYDVVTVGERGQVVVPSNARKALRIKPGDKLLALEGPMGSSVVFFKIKSIDEVFEKMSKALSKIKRQIKE
jgi:AbrB family looped-hinge helix DNA binding protein